mmetsp:Transcript_55282/g.115653  ORF Transcript_55282/g.115653 Transcript_55282/m.115653 type:complete len:201 (+) Transcript_55282:275-877(+)
MMIMSEASCATDVPVIPMDRPTSASFKAGASLVPSPVTATTSPISLRRRTMVSLSWGLHRAMTCIVLSTSFCPSGSSRRKSGPSIAHPSVRIPISREMLLAVSRLSPVIIRTVIPACWHLRTASGTSSRGGSRMPRTPMKVRAISGVGASSSPRTASTSSTSQKATAMVRRPWPAMPEMCCMISSIMLASSGWRDPSLAR